MHTHQALWPHQTPGVPGEILLLVRTPEPPVILHGNNKADVINTAIARQTECGGQVDVSSGALTLKQTNRENGNVITTSAQAHPVINLPHTPGSVGALSSAER